MIKDIEEIFDYLGINNCKELIPFISNFSKKKRFKKNDTIIQEGDYSQNIYILLSGEATVCKIDDIGKEIKLNTLFQGELFGEMAVFLNQKRTASVRAKTDLIVAEFDYLDFIKALSEIPELSLRVISNLVNHLSLTNKIVSNLHEKVLMKSLCFYLINSKDENDKVNLGFSEVTTKLNISEEQLKLCLNKLKSLNLIKNKILPCSGYVNLNLDSEFLHKFLSNF